MKRRNGMKIMGGLIKLLTPMLHVMFLCITLGVLGFLCAIFITVLGSNLVLTAVGVGFWHLSIKATIVIMLVIAVLRAVFRYGEQTAGHYIAFKLLAIIRDKVFGKLRTLAPARLEGKGRGNLIAVITGDIELLEVFYAHTIAPVSIAIVVSLIMMVMEFRIHPLLGLIAAFSYIVIGIIIPIGSSKMGREFGMESRAKLGALNNSFLESLRGMKEILQYDQMAKKEEEIYEKTKLINKMQGGVKKHEAATSSISGALVMIFPLVIMLAAAALKLDFSSIIISTVMLSASFGPVLALANLSSAMDSTLAAGERVLSLLEEEPETEDIICGLTPDFEGVSIENLSFSYDDEEVISNLNMEFPKGKIVAVTGKSGSGKSTMLKLLMRFWKAPAKSIEISNADVGEINTDHLRKLEAYMTQDTDLFNISIGDNIRIGKFGASEEEVIAAAKKARIHDFIMTMSSGYETKIGELGDILSGGEKQRIGLARAFLHDAPLVLLDEPTSNLDSLNEGSILKALREEADESGRTVILVSHRKSTLGVADLSYQIENDRMS